MRLLLLVITRDPAAREAAASQRFVPRVLGLLEAWLKQYEEAVMLVAGADAAAASPVLAGGQNDVAEAAAKKLLQVGAGFTFREYLCAASDRQLASWFSSLC